MPDRLNTFSSLSQNPGHSLLFSYSYHTYIWKAVHNIHEPECYQLSYYGELGWNKEEVVMFIRWSLKNWSWFVFESWYQGCYMSLTLCPKAIPLDTCEEAVVNGFFASSIIPGLMVQIQWDSHSAFKVLKGKYRHTCSPLMALTKSVLQNMSW